MAIFVGDKTKACEKIVYIDVGDIDCQLQISVAFLTHSTDDVGDGNDEDRDVSETCHSHISYPTSA